MAFGKKTVFMSFIWKLLERSSVQVVSFIVTIILARLLTPDDYGSIAIVMVFVNLATVFVEGGLNTALIQKKDSDEKDFSTIFLFSFAVSVIIYTILFFSAPFVARFYSKPILQPVLRAISVILIAFSLSSVQKAYLMKKMLFKELFYSNLGGLVLSAGVGIYMAYAGYGIWALVAQQVTTAFAGVIIMWFVVNWRPMLVFSKERFVKLFNFGWKVFMTNLTISLFTDIRSLIIGRVFNASSLAYFDRGKQFPYLIMDNVNSSIQSVMFPVLSDTQDKLGEVKALMKRTTSVSSYVILPLLMGLLVAAKPLTLFLLTEKWIEIVPFIQIFCIANMLMPIQSVNLVAIRALGYSGVLLKLELIKKVLEVAILIATVFISVKAIAWGVVIYNLICIIINLYPSKKYLGYGIKEQMQDFLPSLYLSVAMGAVIYWIQLLPISNIMILIFQFVAGFLIYWMISNMFKINSYTYILELAKSRISKFKQK
ncbi:Membrane protein involved in the export of O-antigen and teichoic acid [Xylanibacter ruminicola]|uniref:Membrane protein involved in the export of O-antigen and teichoic acid n=1 Tax=Xylanibacter ruminicola TaxID=839 RepID=A0A1M7JHS3_XYLRU|nr:lipopolysaccharide biosynthesis protein [Xylanibacter ruminicola]SHM52582.1 Membrane protein involved in the export of O-antigen and teichoic acid [Xylanibacter ruminicola]